MLFSDSYLTIKTQKETLIKERGSKFLAFIFPVSNESEVKEHLNGLKKEHPTANHHCYAWRLGPDKAAFKTNDDGEPANTAGKPILGQIQANDLTNILVVVVRYFGGTLLGVGGLISAYRAAAAEVIKVSEIYERFILFEYKVDFNEESINLVMRILKESGAKIISHTYETGNAIIFQIKKQNSIKLEENFKELYTSKLKYLKTL
ncbi:MAG: YigZ family protein [Bacteroidetes bacterium]|nr:YigZ family protein [Bacteroidota bacterium]